MGTPVPRKNEPYRLGFCIRNNTNILRSNWTAPAAYISLDASGFSNANDSRYFSSTPTEIDGLGIGYIDITASGVNADLVMVKVCDNSGVALSSQYSAFEKIYPEEPGDYRCDVVQVSGIPVSINDFGGGGSSLTASDVWTHSDRTLTNLGEEAVSGDIAGAVWTALQDDYDHVSDSFGDYLDSEVSKVDASVAIDILTSQQAIQSDINAISGDITNILEDTSAISTSGLATRSQLEYWGLVILNNCGGGPVG